MLVEREVGFTRSLIIYYVTITQATVSKKKVFSRGFKYSRTVPVTRTLKGNEKQFELQLELRRGFE